MRYPQETRERTCQLYREGTPRRQIAETMGIPLKTIQRWTADEVSKPLSFITCEVCGKRKRVLRLPRKYCSEKCKKIAYYLRKNPPPLPRGCLECRKQFKTRRENKEYCSKRCQNTAAQRRGRERTASQCTN